MSQCKSCDAEIIWCETSSGKKMPLDATPNPAAKPGFVVVKGIATIASEADVKLHRDVYSSHFATCHQANPHRV
jgi:hypothetical protein